ncbi:transporter substrate-binding domain-containing protein [Motilimonas cestriensis]|uniref:Transporter substrate-binding domain-containing protein n=1 Tax=Motilimonas cestriensis TaxID=2742685 RepID=A0ABS8WC05_9GAMM|nr:transporter substrate-binding domain-containing protein [Motilimonas cestriensis]MCE2595778.1 transporter substrate-binding domain-containing protein [Motilimonas cestriensis]
MRLAKWLIFLLIYCYTNAALSSENNPKIQVFASIFPPFSYLDQGRVSGVSVNLVRQVLTAAKMDHDVVIFPWARAYVRSQLAPNSLLINVARTPEREALFKWVGEIVKFDVKIFALKGTNNPKPNTLSDLSNSKIGGLRQDVKTAYLQQQGLTVQVINSEENGIRQLLAGRIDYLAAEINSFQYRLTKLQLDPNDFEAVLNLKEISKPLYIALQKDTPDVIVERLRLALNKVVPQPAANIGQQDSVPPAHQRN